MDLPAEGEPVQAMSPALSPWGPWATVGWTLLAMVLFLIVSIGVATAIIIVLAVTGLIDPGSLQEMDFTELLWVDMSASLLAGPAAVLLLLGAIKLRRWPIRRYLAWRSCSVMAMVLSLIGGAAYLGGELLLNQWLDRPIPEFMTQILAVRPAWPVVLLAVVVVAPLTEELVFRGFMYRGLAASRLGLAGAILIPSLLWALVHVQYEWLDVAFIFGLGILLGFTRHLTGSIWPAIGVHVLVNLVSMGLMMIYIATGVVEV